jgi:hypothetical protein
LVSRQRAADDAVAWVRSLTRFRWKNLEPNQRGILNGLFQLNKRVFKSVSAQESLLGLWSYRYEGAMVNYLKNWMGQLR